MHYYSNVLSSDTDLKDLYYPCIEESYQKKHLFSVSVEICRLNLLQSFSDNCFLRRDVQLESTHIWLLEDSIKM